MTTDVPEIGQWVKVSDWCGRIIDIARSETQTMIQVRSFKGIWNHHPTEWLEYREGIMRPASPEEVERDRARYLGHISRAIEELSDL